MHSHSSGQPCEFTSGPKRERQCVCVLPECGKKLGSSAGAARRSSWPAPPAGPALYQDISASTPSRYESPGGKMRGHKHA